MADETNEANKKLSSTYIGGALRVRYYGRTLRRCFNDGLNGFPQDGWTLMNVDATNDIVMSIKRTTNVVYETIHDSIICVRAFVPLQNVLPPKLIGFLKERRGTWMNFNVPDHYAACLRANCFPFPIFYTHHSTEIPVQLGQTDYKDEILEVTRFYGTRHLKNDSEDLYHLQISSGLKVNGDGACSELIFAPLIRSLPNDCTFLSSGFRILSLGSNTDERLPSTSQPSSMLVMAFQFPSSTHLEDDVTALATHYARHLISAVKNISRQLTPNPARANPSPVLRINRNGTYTMNSLGDNRASMKTRFSSSTTYASNPTEAIPTDVGRETNTSKEPRNTLVSTYAIHLANLMCESYRSYLGMEMRGVNVQSSNSLLELIENHQYAIMCFSATPAPTCIYANRTALHMLETTMANLIPLSVDTILGGCNTAIIASLPTLRHQGFAMLPPGFILSAMNHCISYGQAVVWKVPGPDGSLHCLALAITDWSYI